MKYFFVLVILVFSVEGFADYPDPTRWASEMAAFAIEDKVSPPARSAIVATGSSSMRFWHSRIHVDLDPLTIIPRGFGGSTMHDVAFYLEELVLQYEPRALLLYEGDNDVAEGVPSALIITTYVDAFKRMHTRLPELRIYILSVKPSLSRAAMWPQMQAVNAGLKALSDNDPRIIFIDVATPMYDARGQLPANIFVDDMLHMNSAGYDIWRDTVAPILVESESRFEH